MHQINFLIEKIPNQTIEKIIQSRHTNVKFDQKIIKDCESLMKVAEKLDPQFRIQTTQTYLKLEGYNGEIFQLLDFPFMKLLDSKKEFKNAIEALADILVK